MARRGPEGRLIDAVNKHIPKTIHHQSMTFGSRSFNGTPDRYYDGPLGDLWVEYKALTAMPRDGVVVGDYSSLQLRWMTRRYDNCAPSARNVVGVVGLPNRTAVIQRSPTEWEQGTPASTALPIKEVSSWITAFSSQ